MPYCKQTKNISCPPCDKSIQNGLNRTISTKIIKSIAYLRSLCTSPIKHLELLQWRLDNPLYYLMPGRFLNLSKEHKNGKPRAKKIAANYAGLRVETLSIPDGHICTISTNSQNVPELELVRVTCTRFGELGKKNRIRYILWLRSLLIQACEQGTYQCLPRSQTFNSSVQQRVQSLVQNGIEKRRNWKKVLLTTLTVSYSTGTAPIRKSLI